MFYWTGLIELEQDKLLVEDLILMCPAIAQHF